MLRIEVMHMSQLKHHMYQHMRSAKDWLTKAEDAFDKQHNVRAELDLMLAQAELQHATEASRSRQWRYKYLALRHGIALTLAMFMAVAVGGVYWWTNKSDLAMPVPMSGQVSLPVKIATNGALVATPVVISTENKRSVQPVVNPIETPVASKVEQVKSLEQPQYQPEQPVPLSGDEMQKLVRAAGKSLRGQ